MKESHNIESNESVIANKDVAALAQLGYKQEFKRHFTVVECFGLTFSIIGLLPSMASVLFTSLPNGGTVSMVWGWAFASVFIMAIALAMAELGSAAPTSGGLYYWTHRFASPRTRNLLSWIVGYSNNMGLISGITSISYGCAVQIMAVVEINSDDTFVTTTGEIFGVFVALVILQAFVASFGTKIVARLQQVYIAANILLCIGLIISVAVATPKSFRNKASFAFGEFYNVNGWPDVFAFILGLLYPLWVIGGFDMSIHISEEASNAKTAVPIACVSASAIGCVLGWGINVTLAFCMGTDIAGILENPIGQPLATILFNSLGKQGSLVFFSLIIVVQFMMGTSIMIATSRQTFAFARDGALPFSSWIYRINPYTLTPVNAVIASCLVGVILGLLAFAGPEAIGAIFALGVAGQYTAYTVTIGSRFLFKNDFKPGPFSLGRFSLPVAIVAVIWMIFIVTVFMFPTTPHTNSQEMNYTSVVLGGYILLSLIWYYFPKYGGVYWFRGPVANVDFSEETASQEEENAKSEKSGYP